MSRLIVSPGSPLRGQARVPGDKSISHRALMLGALADGVSHIAGFLPGGDCLATLGCMRALGVEIEVNGLNGNLSVSSVESVDIIIHGRGLRGLHAPGAPLDCVRSGTTMRLLAGILAGQDFDSILSGDPQLLRRPMRRVVEPLRALGADIHDTDGHGPLVIHGKQLHGGELTLTVASAQVKSALLLAGLFADMPVTVHQPGPSRDHTERMLKAQVNGKWQMANGESANQRIGESALVINGLTVMLNPSAIEHLAPLNMTVPGDISSAAFPLVAALLVPDSEITLTGININWTRTGLLDVLAAMGAEITLTNEDTQGGEPVADLTVRTASLRGTEIGGDIVVRMIDEFPILAVAATQARGTTLVRDAHELRVKETDRIATVVEELRKLGASIEPREDGFIVNGPTQLRGAVVDSHGDHRLGMALAVAGLIAEGETVIEGAERITDSFPGFVSIMQGLGGHLTFQEAQWLYQELMDTPPWSD
ncbi:MAG TPA: 3-phosphoshikimate 1-carboxyvinyltransferase [Anaerolineae bacterium]|nr:3-phosphoshikimate 1-carboxyvinyltransferase [Anaerolineae bacterium]HQK13622.1 3-phosphoshikimate 1-carboxyvinyltransferase [Anaerolineae bacterium]